MTHYVCTGSCGAESSRPGVCQNDSCDEEGEPFMVCDCEDGAHSSVLDRAVPDDDE